MRSIKGMSPLVATVLLIAFAVALGAMIMNWSTEMEQPSSSEVSTADPCAHVSIALNEVFGKEIFCYQDGAIRFNILNTGSQAITGIQIRTIDANLKEVKQDLPSSSLPVGETFDHQFSYDNNGKVHVEIVPYIIENNKPYYCVKKRLVQDILPACD